MLWFLDGHEAGPYFCPPVLRLADFHSVCCQTAHPASGQGGPEEGIQKPADFQDVSSISSQKRVRFTKTGTLSKENVCYVSS